MPHNHSNKSFSIKSFFSTSIFYDFNRETFRTTPREKKNNLVQNSEARLVNTYEDDIAFFQTSEGLPEVAYSTKHFSYNARFDTKEKIKSTGKMIRQVLLCARNVYVPWPLGENQLFQGNFQTTELTNLLLTSILYGKGK